MSQNVAVAHPPAMQNPCTWAMIGFGLFQNTSHQPKNTLRYM